MTVKVYRVSPLTRKGTLRELPTTQEKVDQWFRWNRAPGTPHIQDYFPELNAADREFILTGHTQEDWDTLWPPCNICGDVEEMHDDSSDHDFVEVTV